MNEPAEIRPDPKAEALIANITKLMDEAEQMLGDSTSQHGEGQVELLNARCDDLRAQFGACCASAGRRIAAGTRRADQAIRVHPYKSLAVALGVGVVLGRVLGRRSS